MTLLESDAVNNFADTGSLLTNNIGEDLDSTGADVTLAPTHRYHYVLATGSIKNLTVPFTGFKGAVTLIFDAAATTVATGNIAKAITAIAKQAVTFYYHAGKGLWYPDGQT